VEAPGGPPALDRSLLDPLRASALILQKLRWRGWWGKGWSPALVVVVVVVVVSRWLIYSEEERDGLLTI